MVTIDTQRTAPIVNGLMNTTVLNAVCQRTPSWPRRSREMLTIPRSRGVRGSTGFQTYDFGDSISKPAMVVDGQVVFADGSKPR